MSVSISSNDASPAIAFGSSKDRTEQSNRLQQSVLQIVGWQPPAVQGQVSEEILDSMRHLMAVLKQLRSPDGGWPAELPQTPEHLAPYVTEEGQDVFNALQATPLQPASILPNEGEPHWQQRLLMEDVASWLLWAIARSTYGVMRLLEGIPARVLQPHVGWQTGIARLVPALHLTLSDTPLTLDLTTRYPCPPLLPATATLHTEESDLCHEPTWLEGFLQGLAHHIQTTTPTLATFLDGTQVAVLVPQSDWQIGTLQLVLGIEFQADTEGEMLDPVASPLPPGDSSIPDAEFAEVAPDAIAPVCQGRPLIRFTNREWLQRYQQRITRQYLMTVLPYLNSIATPPHPRGDRLTQLVQDAGTASDWLDHSLTVASRNFPPQEWSLAELSLRLLWSMSRGGYGITRLMTGIPCAVLQAGQDWNSGVLRLQICLTIATPELDWQLDLVTGHGVDPRSPILEPLILEENALVRSPDPYWSQMLQVGEIDQQVMEQVQHTTPEIEGFLQGTEIDLAGDDNHWQPGIIHLKTQLQFMHAQ